MGKIQDTMQEMKQLTRRVIIHTLIIQQMSGPESALLDENLEIMPDSSETHQIVQNPPQSLSDYMEPPRHRAAQPDASYVNPYHVKPRPTPSQKDPFRWIVFDKGATPPFDPPEFFKVYALTTFKIAKGLAVFDVFEKKHNMKAFAFGYPGVGIARALDYTWGATNAPGSSTARASFYLWNLYSAYTVAQGMQRNATKFKDLNHDFLRWARLNSKQRALTLLGPCAQFGEVIFDIYGFYKRMSILFAGEGEIRTGIGALENVCWISNSAGMFMTLLKYNPALAKRFMFGGCWGAVACRLAVTIITTARGVGTVTATATPIDENGQPAGPDTTFSDVISTEPRLLDPKNYNDRSDTVQDATHLIPFIK